MTVAVMVKVFDGVVLAADSAATMRLQSGDAQVWTNANKVFQLHREYPIGAMTWGEGQLGNASISSHAKELRRRLTGRDGGHSDWKLEDGYTIEDVTARLVELIGELYKDEPATRPGGQVGLLGFLVAGYSDLSNRAEAREVIFTQGNAPEIRINAALDEFGWAAFAQTSATQRLFNGMDERMYAGLRALVGPDEAAALMESHVNQPAEPAMPFADAVDLARFMVDVTIGYTRFIPGSDTVGGRVDIAAITDHEGFKWVERKHYYPLELNRETTHR